MFQISENGKFETPIIFGGDTIIEEFSLKRKVKLFTQNQGDPELGNPKWVRI